MAYNHISKILLIIKLPKTIKITKGNFNLLGVHAQDPAGDGVTSYPLIVSHVPPSHPESKIQPHSSLFEHAVCAA